MASTNEHKTTDLDSLEQGLGNGDKRTTPAIDSQTVTQQESSVLEVRTLRQI